MSDMEHAQQVVDQLVMRLRLRGYRHDHLENLVTEKASAHAEKVIQEGLEAQVRYLMLGEGPLIDPEEISKVMFSEDLEGTQSPAFTAWRKRLRDTVGTGETYRNAMSYAGRPCRIVEDDSLGKPLWAIVVNDDFWMEAMESEEEALQFVKDIGWPLED